MASLYETYRPKVWSDVIGQPKAIGIIDSLRASVGLAGQVYWVTGPSGTGKTTISRLIAAEIADDWATEELNGADVSLDVVRQWEDRCRFRPLGMGQHCIIINEAHALSGRVVSRLLTTLEKENVQITSTWIFTTTTDGANLFDENFDSAPFLSRCQEIALTSQGLCPLFAARLREIATELNLNGQPIERYQRLVKDSGNNMRACLQAIASGRMLSHDQ
jgi:replication-associated recombination protein RarA